jgi:hypothetical protein
LAPPISKASHELIDVDDMNENHYLKMLHHGKLTNFSIPWRNVDFFTLDVIEEWMNEATSLGTR